MVYSAKEYDFEWEFDIERTRKINHCKPPSDSNLVIDFSAVMYPGELKSYEARDAVLRLPGAKEIHAESHALRSSTWTTAEWSFTAPDRTETSERFEAMLGFLDPCPDYLTVFWRKHPVSRDYWDFTKTDEWVHISTEGAQDKWAPIVFFRVRRVLADLNSTKEAATGIAPLSPEQPPQSVKTASSAFPLWDGKETQAVYASRAGIKDNGLVS